MKTKFILVLILALFTINGGALTTRGGDREIELSHLREGELPRSTDAIPAEAFIRASFVYIEFTENVINVTASIINNTTGESVFMQTYSSPSDISIDLEGENSGNYKLVMEIDGMVVWGSFNL